MNETNHDGFTLMESLVSIAVILIMSGCIFITFTAGTKANSKSVLAAGTANKILETDRFIREKADFLHVPYWLKPDESVEEFKRELQRSRAGKYIRGITTVYDSSGKIKGVDVNYVIEGRAIKTTALFPFNTVIEAVK
jgi:prepilin-type N-terminal cleavage/methylation domain-containing protein